ncbi:unnamed protein product [Soboliphyme baturini]|uniref:MPN domain-containing protein n=1 Tax=Soboliphyme baturini TaxID=241478 RepID=A0A183IBE8_9BILA|nr:unnamed protein product [Soboliphyme baturini]
MTVTITNIDSCSNATPPYDEDYLNKKEIKHMSFHSYLRKILGGKSTTTTCPLEKAVCKIKPGCVLHPPWPEGICSKCQPDAAITLNLQRYRHVDNISFENEFLVNRFLDYWRQCGQQRVGYLLGRYEPYYDVPLGIRAVVSAIYEPPQMSGENFVQLEDDATEQQVDALCKALEIRRIGWIFTDLVAEPKGNGSVKHTRHADTYLISAEECITAGYLQNRYPNVCKYSPDAYFGSKFVTVIVSGGEDHQVHFFGYQVSNLCASLVDANCLFPTMDAPELAYVKESSSLQYVPDVYYKKTDEYKNEVLKIGRPLPVEYLVVDIPAGMPKEPLFSFFAGTQFEPFAVENRMALHAQSLDAVRSYVSQFGVNQIMEMSFDFHFLLYLLLNEFCKFTMVRDIY